VFDFRDVSSAREDRETTIHQARKLEAAEVPRARGEAALVLARAQAAADAQVAGAAGESESFTNRAGAVAGERRLLEHLLWIESAERTLAGREKVIVPRGSGDGEVSLWRRPR
jgi:membrane protease subunit HflK